MDESMDNDHVAAVALARWPEVKSPFFDDLRRMHKYAPVLGRFVTFSDFFQKTDSPTRHALYKPGEYLTPYLFQSVAREEEDPISRFTRHVRRRSRVDACAWLHGVHAALSGRAPSPAATNPLERDIELLGERPAADAVVNVEKRLERSIAESGAA